ncbi:MAG TPA: hypothetical protein VG826_01370 [Pirellulales bacterium]|nr:hypothetical protein [Pirellulales bacterium]
MTFPRSRFAAAVLAGTGCVLPTIALYGQAPKTKDAAAANSISAADQVANEPVANATDGKQRAVKSRSELLAAERFALIRRRVAAAEIRSDEADFPTRFAAKPIFRYSDLARGHVAAAVWKLGEEGRPKAILSTELDRFSTGRPCICHEYISLTTTPFSVVIDGMRWTPAGTLYEFKPIPDAPAPEETPRRRLFQIRELANRFAAREVEKNEKIELRLLPQPVDRYVPSKAERADGAIFFFTFGTNPEVMLLIESDGEQWSYAAGRMTGAEVVVLKIDEAVAWQGEPLHNVPDSPHTGFVAPIEIPGISADGREVEE